MNQLLLAVLIITLLLSVAVVDGRDRRITREVEEKVKNLDQGTKKRILAMSTSGMPDEAIAHSISYVSGGNKQTAHGIINGVKKENTKLQQTNKNQKIQKEKLKDKATATVASIKNKRK